jgi:dsDNA-specific endonuclease/ATPase MutS2
MPDTFESFIQQERERLSEARQEAQERLNAAKEELAAIDREEQAIAAYERVKQGLPQTQRTQRATGTGRGTPGERQRAPRGERSAQILEIVRTNPGIDTSGICEKLGVTDDKGVASVRAAIFQLGKKGQIEKEGKGRYIVAEGG